MAKRKSITGVKKKKKTAGPGPSICSPPSSDLESAPKRKQLLSTRNEYTVSKNSRAGQIMKPSPEPLRAQTKHVSQKTIETKWTVLDQPAQDGVRRLFQAAELPVLAKCASEQNKIEAQETLVSIRQNLLSRLPKMPIPPKTNASDFDHAKLVKSNRESQQRLQSTRRNVASRNNEIQELKATFDAETHEIQSLEDLLTDDRERTKEPRFLLPLNGRVLRKDLPLDIGLMGSDSD